MHICGKIISSPTKIDYKPFLELSDSEEDIPKLAEISVQNQTTLHKAIATPQAFTIVNV